MSEGGAGAPPGSAKLNANQARRIVSSIAYVDDLLRDIERLARLDPTAFTRERPDVGEGEARMVLALVDTARRRMLALLDRFAIPRPAARMSARWSMTTAFRFIDIALSELTPGTLRGYGDIDPGAAADIQAAAATLRELMERGRALLEPREGEALRARVANVPGPYGEILRQAEGLSASRGLAEVRPLIAAAAERAVTSTIEVGVFGRVSSGKSSLINALVGAPLLPVGATPVTAVPLRVLGGDPDVRVRFLDGREAVIDLAQLPEYATERGNRDNARGVQSVVIRTPHVPEGLALLDTPGVGSMSQSGPAQAFASLPRCDLGIVLVAAGTPVGRDELALVQGLTHAGIAVEVLLSKSDLLAELDREQALAYVRGELASAARGEIAVLPISVSPEGRALLDRWRDAELRPMLAQRERIAAAVRARRVHALLAALAQGLRDRSAASEASVARQRTRIAAQRQIESVTDAVENAARAAIDAAAHATTAAWREGTDGRAAARAALAARAAEALAAVREAADSPLGDDQAIAVDAGTRIPPLFDPPLLDAVPVLPRGGVAGALAPEWTARRALAAIAPALDAAYSRYAQRLRAWALARLEENADRAAALSPAADETYPDELRTLAALADRHFPLTASTAALTAPAGVPTPPPPRA